MNYKQTDIRDITAENFEQILLSICKENVNVQNMIFPEEMIKEICNVKQYPCYKFAHNLNGDSYIRAWFGQIIVEFLVVTNQKNPEQKEYHVLQILKNGQKIYYKP